MLEKMHSFVRESAKDESTEHVSNYLKALPYFCPHCVLCKQNTDLKSLANALSEELPNLRSTIKSLKQTIEKQQKQIALLQNKLSV